MKYKATTNRWLQVTSLLLILFIMFTVTEIWMLYYLIPLAIFVFLTIFMVFTVVITDGFLTFQIQVLTLTIYKKTVSHEQIEMLKYKRVGWWHRCVIVKNYKGFNFRIVNFSSHRIYNDLIEFASKYDIPIEKTKEYILLER